METNRKARDRKTYAEKAVEFDMLIAAVHHAEYRGMQTWAEFVETLHVPADMMPALSTNRVELMKLAQPRALTVEECELLYSTIAALLRTNEALQAHARDMAKITDIIETMQLGFTRRLRQMGQFANFQTASEGDDEA